MLNNECIEMIALYLKTNEKMREIIKYMYENTELYEEKYMSDYRKDLFNFFAGKIQRCTKDFNKLMEILKEDEIKMIKKEMLK